MSNKYKARRLDDKVAIVTAATNGIGLAIAERLGHEGARVVISSRREGNVKAALTQLIESGLMADHIHAIVCHVGDATHRQRLVDETLKRFGRIDILVNNAGINPLAGDILDVDETAWDKLFAVNVKAGFLLSKMVVSHMLKNGGGSIVFNASVAAYLTPTPIAAYGVTKTAVLGLTRALSDSLAPRGIRVNCVSPGVIKTNMSEMLWKNDGTANNNSLTGKPEFGRNPMGRYGAAKECAGVVAFLVSDDASYISGENVIVAGGEYSRL